MKIQEWESAIDSITSTLQHASVWGDRVDELKNLQIELKRFEYKLIERIQNLEQSPPTLGIHVSEDTHTEDVPG